VPGRVPCSAPSDTNGPRVRAVPLSPIRRFVLKALSLGACAFVLLVTPIAAHAVPAPPKTLQSDLRGHIQELRKSRSVVEFFESHRWLLRDPRFRTEAERQLAKHRAALASLERARARLAERRRARQRAILRARTPESVVCDVFRRHCRQALQVARCESGFSTTAANGQYLGLFQMGSSERQLFGHGASAKSQAKAAYRYFLTSGRDWSPWSCKPW
jgi:hypothetical protein